MKNFLTIFCILSLLPLLPVFAVDSSKSCKSMFDYSNSNIFPSHTIKYSSAWREKNQPFVSRDLKIADLADVDGFLWLFRVINDEYQPGFDESIFIKGRNELGYSYSINPHIGRSWSLKSKFILIARQNLKDDHLMFPGRTEQGRISYQIPLKPETQINEILQLDEVKVPVDKENVVGIIDLATFDEIANRISKTSTSEFIMSDFLNMIMNSKNIRHP